ncbi:MAG: site-specific DNA-methyltransferase [Candidatus Hodarchaeota archaeon]
MAQIQFKGKSFVQNHHLLVKYHELIPIKNKSLTDKVSLHDNLIIYGDNLKALKALLPIYAGKIKCIYIDPPYNTGNEKWVYNDNVNSPMMQQWLGKAVDQEDLTRHDKWLCMMMPRLKLLKELLRDDGVIFASIDDNEIHRLRLVMDEVFGEEHRVGTFTWRRRMNPDSRNINGVSEDHEYVLCYVRSEIRFTGSEKNLEKYTNPDDDPRGPWMSMDMTGLANKQQRPNLHYSIVDPSTGKSYDPPPQRGWAYSKDRVITMIEKGEVIFPATDRGRPRQKKYLKDLKTETMGFSTWLDLGFTNTDGTRMLQRIFQKKVFDFPKPVELIQSLISQVTSHSDIILDSFAGSGTTAHATLAINKEDGGKRKFILVECENYANELTAERVRRVINGVPEAKDENLKKGLGGTFSYFELGEPIELENILSGDRLPSYSELARYIFYTATGEEFDAKALNEKNNFVGESRNYKVYLFYEPNIEKLKNIALTLDRAKSIGKPGEKRRLVFAPTKYLDQAHLDELRIDFAQLPFEIYELAR